MTSTAVFLVTLSAFSHALWNLIGKKRNPSIAFFTFSLLSAALCFSPAILCYRESVRALPPIFWKLLCATAISQALYFIGLAGAYQRGEISLTYPLARALPVLLVAVHGVIVGGLSLVSPAAILGMLLIVVACLIAPMQHWRDIALKNYLNSRSFFIMIAAVGGAGYSIVDYQALVILRADSTGVLDKVSAPVLYIALQSLSTLLIMSVATCCSAAARRRFKIIGRVDLRYALLSGLIISGTYLLVLGSMAYASHVSFIVALRQLSIPIAAVLGIMFLQEEKTLPKTTGVSMIFLGVIIVILNS